MKKEQLVLFGEEIRRRRRELPGEVTQRGLRDMFTKNKAYASIINDIEAGRILDPGPELLKELSEILSWEYDEMIAFIVREKYGVHLIPARDQFEGMTVSVASSVVEGLRIRTVVTRLPPKK